MATLETRDFLGMLDHHSSSSSLPLLCFSLRPTKSDCSNNAERVCEDEAATTHAAVNNTSTTRKRQRSAVDQTFMHGGDAYAYHNISPAIHVLVSPLLRNSVTPLRIPFARKASLTRFFQKRNERLHNVRLNECNSSSARSATFLQLKSEIKSETIPAHTEFEQYGLFAKRQCMKS